MNKNRSDTQDDEVVQSTESAAEYPVSAKQEKGQKIGPMVYCGPTVRGVARQYTVYSGSIPEELASFIDNHPAARALVVPVEHFAQLRLKLEEQESAEAILYRKIKAEAEE